MQAAVDAGGTVVSDAEAPAFWVLADPEGNRMCLCTWQGRSGQPPRAKLTSEAQRRGRWRPSASHVKERASSTTGTPGAAAPKSKSSSDPHQRLVAKADPALIAQDVARAHRRGQLLARSATSLPHAGSPPVRWIPRAGIPPGVSWLPLVRPLRSPGDR